MAAVAALALGCADGEALRPVYRLGGAGAGLSWAEWGRTPDHASNIDVTAATPKRVLSTLTFDPFIPDERTEGDGDVLIHYQSPLLDGGDVFMEVKGGAYRACDPPGSGNPSPCGSAAWSAERWSEARFVWQDGELVEKWRFESDWTPEPDDGGFLAGWEPVFHAALAGDYLVVPGAGGSVHVIARGDGSLVDTVDPFGDTPDPSTFVAGPITVASDGTVYYDAIALDPENPWTTDVAGAWLVQISPDGVPKAAPFGKLVPAAPAAADACTVRFSNAELPWPPAPDAKPPSFDCGSQRPGVNVAPAVAPDGTVYTVSRAHFVGSYGYLVAVSPDLTPKWAASLRGRLDDGCGSALLPPDGQPGGCRAGAPAGVDPGTNEPPAGGVTDLSSASPTVTPDGSVLYGTYTGYNYARGHLMKFSAGGSFLAAYDFGWDVTPGIWRHEGTYSVIIKDNHYDVGSYCDDMKACPPAKGGPYDITQLDASLTPEWSFTSTNTMSCARAADGTVSCKSDHPNGFEWCINAPAVDRYGTVYANGEDGVVYSIAQGGKLGASLFLSESVGAAYTPLSIDAEGRVHAENFGTLAVVGE